MQDRNQLHARTALVVALMFSLSCAFASTDPTGSTDEQVVILTGWLHVEGLSYEDVVFEVVVNGTSEIGTVSETGKFSVGLPADAEVLLRFEKPGHLTKEVVVDTRHATDGEPGQRTRRLKFAVIMELERRMGGLTYSGPTGTIAFEQGGGCMMIDHDRKLVPADQRKLMEF